MYYELLDQNINESGGAQKTGDSANEKGAVTATLSRQNDVNAAVDGPWQLPPFCKYPVAGPSCLMRPRASRTSITAKQCGKLQQEDEKCAMHFESRADPWIYR